MLVGYQLVTRLATPPVQEEGGPLTPQMALTIQIVGGVVLALAIGAFLFLRLRKK